MAGGTTLETTSPQAVAERPGPPVGQPESATEARAQQVAQEAQNKASNQGPEAALEGIAKAQPSQEGGNGGNAPADGRLGNQDEYDPEQLARFQQWQDTLKLEQGKQGAGPQASLDVSGGGSKTPEIAIGAAQQPESSGKQNVTDGANSETDEDRWYRRYENMALDRLDAKRNSFSRRIETRQSRLERRVLTPEQEGALEAEIERLEAEQDVVDSILAEKKGDSSGDRGGKRMTREESQEAKDEAGREARERQDEYRRLARLSLDELNTEARTEETVLRATRRELDGSASGVDRSEINKRIRDSGARLEAINNLRELREPEKLKKETQADEARNKKEMDELLQRQRDSASRQQLEEIVGGSQNEIKVIEDGIKLLEEKMARLDKNDEQYKDLGKERGELAARANEVGQRLTAELTALDSTREREAVEKGLEQVPGIENVRKMSLNEFRGLSVEDQAKYLAELGEFINMPDDIQYAALKEIARNGGAMSIEQRATFAKRLGKELLGKGVKGYGMENVVKLMKQYPDVAKVAFDEIIADKAIREQLDQLPEELKKGKGIKNLLLLLLMILGSAILSSVGAVVAKGKQESFKGMAGSTS